MFDICLKTNLILFLKSSDSTLHVSMSPDSKKMPVTNQRRHSHAILTLYPHTNSQPSSFRQMKYLATSPVHAPAIRPRNDIPFSFLNTPVTWKRNASSGRLRVCRRVRGTLIISLGGRRDAEVVDDCRETNREGWSIFEAGVSRNRETCPWEKRSKKVFQISPEGLKK